MRAAPAFPTPLLYGGLPAGTRGVYAHVTTASRLARCSTSTLFLDVIGNTPLVEALKSKGSIGRREGADRARQGGVPQPGRFREGPDRRAAWSRRPRTRASSSRAARSSSRPAATPASASPSSRRPKGYRCVFVCPDKVSEDKRNVLRAYGAEVVVCPTAVDPEDPRSYYFVSDRLVVASARCLEARPVQQPGEPAVALRDDGAGDLGADRGPDHALRRRRRHRRHDQRCRPLPQGAGRVQVIGADPAGSVYSGGTGRPYLVEGVGEDFWPDAYDRDVCDRIIEVTDRLLRVHPAAGPRGGPARRWLVRHGRGRRAPARRLAGPPRRRTPWWSCCCPTAVAATSRRSSTTAGCPPTASCRRLRADAERRRRAGGQGRGEAGVGARPPERDGPRRDQTSCGNTGSRRCRWSGPSRPLVTGEVVGSVVERTCSTASSPARPCSRLVGRHMSAAADDRRRPDRSPRRWPLLAKDTDAALVLDRWQAGRRTSRVRIC